MGRFTKILSINRYLTTFLICAACLFGYTIPSNAQTPALIITPDDTTGVEMTGCATDTWTSMVNHAVNQSRREVAFNKRYITKNDSVLQYSCFNEALQATSAIIAPIFSGGQTWVGNSVDILGESVTVDIFANDAETENGYITDYLSPTTLDESLTLVVDAGFQGYINGQFNHPYISGSSPVGGTGLEPCTSMSAIWRAAKCKNFDGTLVFPTFEQMAAGFEPRSFPSGSNWECNP